MHLLRDTTRFIDENLRTLKVILTGCEKKFPINVEVIPHWPNYARLRQEREIWIVNLTHFGEGHGLKSTGSPCHRPRDFCVIPSRLFLPTRRPRQNDTAASYRMAGNVSRHRLI